MKVETIPHRARGTSLIKKCHSCGNLNETQTEPMKCQKCSQSYLPLQYFSKVHSKNNTEFEKLFAAVEEIHEEDLIKGLYVLW
ncbi:MAG: hypothetical protein COW00_13070 [Bdellovibrio sp. CG12_big_fil_rev_8_21_14_0_65_39_13]|nr:MAG: hypothetical protein COW78_05390 [Bdellovibrio sp. CG22_combo_CG10-13_8_21_14_all_39_27]PIQ59011.1 MAG: hypothetical protein COW00_13070 [Bdellovibrio sp. CG12_big_fil_rev_8_21_14_0_65_39_13]PIR33441.1 MAG: hypothetical protein COV37_16340 [Bdellovibrio sp. CG11_big_fil_rev_8_21_14_0_20_39_38]PJB54094.1 MAG: hypothetical protein CO099_03510 [Bdellovibrio sp. CG_4_9_14_3_um_filter_39_7]